MSSHILASAKHLTQQEIYLDEGTRSANNIMSESRINNPQNSIDISFKDVHYTVMVPDQKSSRIPICQRKVQKKILKGVSGIFKAGTVTAIMGASGAGKTTLLNILACRISIKGNGKILANNKQYDFQKYGDFANYVMQKDILMETLTVRQTLEFACKVKLNFTQEKMKRKIAYIVRQLKLQNCLDTKIGGVIYKGISGGQRKRTSIAYQLITDPQVLMLDEPTSGLDSLTSYIIVSYLSRLAHLKNRTIITTIHQPNSQTFALFDNLVLMVDGKFVYDGPAKNADHYFNQNFQLSCPQFVNPSDYFMSILHFQKQENVKRYPIMFQTFNNTQTERINKQIQDRNKEEFQFRIVDVPFWQSFGALVHRNLLNTIRNPLVVRARFLQTIFLALYAGGIYWNKGQENFQHPKKWVSITGFFFFLSINNMIMSLSPIAITFPLERDVFLRQQNSKMYGVTQYFLSRNIIEIPYLIILPLVYTLIFYWMVHLAQSVQQFFICYLALFLVSLAGNSLGLFLGSVINNARSISIAMAMIILPVILFSGYFKNTGDLPVWIGWIQYISPITYSFNILVHNEVLHKDSLIDQMNFDTSQIASIFILLGLGISFRLMSWIGLVLLRSRQQ